MRARMCMCMCVGVVGRPTHLNWGHYCFFGYRVLQALKAATILENHQCRLFLSFVDFCCPASYMLVCLSCALETLSDC